MFSLANVIITLQMNKYDDLKWWFTFGTPYIPNLLLVTPNLDEQLDITDVEEPFSW